MRPMNIFIKAKFLFLLLFVFTSVSNVLAQVVITRPTGGQNISTDKAFGGTAAGYTALGDIIIADQAAGDFSVGTNRKIYLVPSATHWQIEPGVGSVSFGGTNITAASILVETNKVTITYTVVGTSANDNSMTISGIRVQSNTTLREPTAASLRRTTSSTLGGPNNGTINGFGNNGQVATLSEIAGVFTKLQVLLPGETSAPGTPSGKTGTPTDRSAGTAFNVVVNAVDAYWNRVAVRPTIAITTTDPNATLPANAALGATGTRNFSVTLRTIGSATVTATDVSAGVPPVVSQTVNVISGGFARLQLLLPGETAAPGTATGKTGTPTARVAGVPFNVTVNAVDASWNVVNAVSDVVAFTATNDAYAQLPSGLALVNGTLTTSVTYRIGNGTVNRRLTVADVTDNTKTSNQSPSFAVNVGPFSRLLVILPGETYVAGHPNGKTGAPTARVAGVPFSVTVNAVDAAWNIITTVNDAVNFTATNDAYAQLPVGAVLSNGTLTTNVTYRIGNANANRRLTATHATATLSQSPFFGVNVGAYARLLIILPGETFTAGHPDGKIGPAGNQGIGTNFQVTVRATDIAFNQVVGPTDQVQITSTDPIFSSVPATGALSATTGQRTFTVNLGTASNSNTLTAAVFPGPSSILPYTTLGIAVLSPSNSSDLFRSAVATGNWNNSTSWESFTGGAWQPSTLVPAIASAGITVRSGNTINVTAPLTIDDVTIESGGQVTLTTGNLTVNNGAAGTDFVVAGILRANNARTITTTGALQFVAGGKYEHAYTTTSGTIPTATWSTGSVCEIVGYTNFADDVAGTNQTFSDFVWNTTALTGSPSLLSGFAARNFTVTSTGTSGTLNLAATGGTTSITGNYTQTAGNVIANKTSGTHNLSFAGNVAVNGGSFGLGNGTVNINFNGTSQSIVNSGSAIAFQNVNFSNGGTKTLTSGNFTLASSAVLTMGASTTLNANGNLTLLSDASSSATIAPISSDSEITGNVNVQRFISGGTASHRTYRMLSSPVYDNGNSGNRQYSFAQFADDMIVSGSGAGFYPTPNNAASAWTYDGTLSGDKYVPISSINTSVPIAQGAYLFYRGDKVNNLSSKVAAPYAIPESFPMTFTGVLNQQNVGLSLTTGFNLVGNPYASSIDWNTIAKTNLQNNTIRIWNPSSRSYASYNGDTGVPSGMNNIIPAGQGFFVQSNAGGSLSFTESSKVSSQPSSLLMSSPLNEDLMANEVLPANGKVMVGGNGGSALAAQRTELRFALKKADLPYQIETAVVLQEGRNAAYSSGDDVNYITASGDEGTQVFFSTLSNDNRKLTINYLPEVSASATVKLDLDTRNAAGDYTLHINTIKDMPAGYIAKLNDALLGTSTVVQNGDIYPFTINANNAASAGATRFSVSFEAPVTLPVDLSVFAVAKTNQGVAVKWSTKTEVNNDRFELERAGENGVYTKIYTEYAKGSGYSYNYLDRAPLLGNNYYRLVQFDLDGKKTISEPKVINYSNEIGNAEGLAIYPNPVKDKFILKFNGVLQSNSQTVRVISSLGQIVLTKAVSKADLLAGHEFVAEGISSGVYVVEILDNGNQKNGQLKMIKQ